jgi:hypothetical protein
MIDRTLYSLDEDIQLNQQLVIDSIIDEEEPFQAIFNPKIFLEKFGPLEMDQYRLEDEKLLNYAQVATGLRSLLAEEALASEQAWAERLPAGTISEKRIDTLVQKRYDHGMRRQRGDSPKKRNEDVSIVRVKSRKTLCQLTSHDMEAIIRSVKEEKLTHQDAADQHQVKVAVVHQLMSKTKRDQEFLPKRKAKEAEKATVSERVQSIAQQFLSQGRLIKSVSEFTKAVNQGFQTQAKEWSVRLLLKHGLGFKYKKLSKVAVQANSERCLVQRQQYALQMLALLQQRKRILNIDQSFLDYSTYQRRHWQAPMNVGSKVE